MSQQINERQNPSDKEIATQAYYLWEADGKPPGRDLEYWMKAKEQLSEGTRQTSLVRAQTANPTPQTAQNGEQQPRKQRPEARNRTSKQPAYV